MDDDWAPDWVSLAAQRERWLRVRLRHERLLPARLAVRAHTHFAAFVEEVFGAQGRPGSLNLEVSAAAIVFFGPPGPPPPEVWNAYVTLHRELAATASDAEALNVFDLVLAFGCGWRRPIDRRRGGWWGRWETAYATMINQVRASLVATGRLLDNQFPQFPLNDDDLLELPGTSPSHSSAPVTAHITSEVVSSAAAASAAFLPTTLALGTP